MHRLQGLQFRIDMEKTRAHTAMKSCIKISSMMWDSFLEFNDASQKMLHDAPRNTVKQLQPTPAQDAQILKFKEKNS